MHQVAFFEFGGRVQEAVGRDKIDLGMLRPTCQQGLQHSRDRAFAHCDRPGDTYDEGDFARVGPHELLRAFIKLLNGCHVEAQQT